MKKLKALQVTGNTSYCMAVHPLGDYIIVGT